MTNRNWVPLTPASSCDQQIPEARHVTERGRRHVRDHDRDARPGLRPQLLAHRLRVRATETVYLQGQKSST
jgi:hypothetical protein